MNRKIFLITIYYILGTIGGLYFKNIIPFFIVILMINIVLFQKSKRKMILLFIIFSISLYKANALATHIKNVDSIEKMEFIGNTESIIEKSSSNQVIISIDKLNGKKVFFKTKVKAYIKNNKAIKVGDKVKIRGTKKTTIYTKNEGCFDYKKYLYSKGIYADIDVESINLENGDIGNYFIKFIDIIRVNIKSTFYKYLDENNREIATALVIGDKNNFDENIADLFTEAGLSHIIAISGMHTVYVAYIGLIFKSIIGKRKSYIFVIIILFLFCNITNNTESVYRASIMLSLFYLSKILYRKSDSLSNLFISIILGLIKNPFCIYSPGFILSTAGTFGIITIYEQKIEHGKKVKSYIINQIKLGIAANIILIPIVAKMYNKVSLIFLVSSFIINFFVTILMPAVFLFGIMGIFNGIIPGFVLNIIGFIVNILTGILIKLAYLFGKLKVLNIQVLTPSLFTIITYYIIVFFICKYRKEKIRKCNEDGSINMYKKATKYVVVIYMCVSVITNIYIHFNRNLTIYFVDVGQGDCTLIMTPYNHSILIDGGGNENGKSDDVGEKIVVPFLLNKHVKKIDYIVISHFDSDHVGGILTVMKKFKVKNVIISRQGEDSANYRMFKEIVNRKGINVIIVEKGQRIDIEKDLFIDVLWPEKDLINENILNNNSIVCKLNYNSFSMLFTGDIEAIAEEKIVNMYKNDAEKIRATCLKAGHHGSKTSSTEELLNIIKPKYVFIGVGIDNKFNHPSEEVIDRYNNLGLSIYRTNQDGEIVMTIKKDGRVSLKKFTK